MDSTDERRPRVMRGWSTAGMRSPSPRRQRKVNHGAIDAQALRQTSCEATAAYRSPQPPPPRLQDDYSTSKETLRLAHDPCHVLFLTRVPHVSHSTVASLGYKLLYNDTNDLTSPRKAQARTIDGLPVRARAGCGRRSRVQSNVACEFSTVVCRLQCTPRRSSRIA